MFLYYFYNIKASAFNPISNHFLFIYKANSNQCMFNFHNAIVLSFNQLVFIKRKRYYKDGLKNTPFILI
jgi:hypothetical protein